MSGRREENMKSLSGNGADVWDVMSQRCGMLFALGLSSSDALTQRSIAVMTRLSLCSERSVFQS
jgi:hypothetical protein